MQVLPTFQPNWILVDKSPNVRLIISEEVVMQPRFTEGGQTLQQRYRQQTHFGRLFVRTVFRHHQRCKTQRYRTVQRSNDVMAVRIFAEPNLFAFLGTYKRDASENFQTTLLHCWGLTQSMLVRRYKKISKYR